MGMEGQGRGISTCSSHSTRARSGALGGGAGGVDCAKAACHTLQSKPAGVRKVSGNGLLAGAGTAVTAVAAWTSAAV